MLQTGGFVLHMSGRETKSFNSLISERWSIRNEVQQVWYNMCGK